MKNISLNVYSDDQDSAIFLIQSFWKEHNGNEISIDDAKEDLQEWTSQNHRFYFILESKQAVGFVHLASRGGSIDWVEDLFVLPPYQGQGIGSYALKLVEELVRTYSESLYIEVAARNNKALRLYEKVGFDCLNTLTLRKDFDTSHLETIGTQKVMDASFDIRRMKQ
ncbi:MAG TPA: GNAT family N-acetyltransferase [Candidatus Tetragenococcus pullicola]|nr:GNAT family N-acetyltransferase [Candidatus Tetragenococcus pullicola]